MKNMLFSIAFSVAGFFSFAQVGAVTTDFTVTDINGATHNLYTYLNAGKVVILDCSATWCGPCWNFHSAHYLEDLYAEYGPNGTDEVVILFYEADGATTAADLNGTGSNTQGDWVTGTPYPIINESPIQLSGSLYWPLGYPTINLICPSDRKIKWDLWDSQTSQGTAQSLENMRSKVQEVIDQCASTMVVTEQNFLEASLYPNPAGEQLTVTISNASEEDYVLTVFGISGQVVSTQEVVSGTDAVQVDLSGLESGSYFIQVSGSASATRMIPFVKK